MSQPVLGALAGKKTRTHDDFVRRFLDTLTVGEREMLAEMPPLRDEHQLIAIITTARATLRRGLPAGHPLGATP